MAVVDDYTALLSGNYWGGIEVTNTPVIVTFSFPTSLPAYDASVPGFTADTLASFQAFTAGEQAQALAALGEWSAASGLVFVQVAPGLGDINFQNIDFNTTSAPSYAGAGGIGFYPFGNWNFFSYPSFSGDLDASGDVFMNTQYLSGGEVNYGTLLHEIGHAIGLKHPTETVTDNAAAPPVTHDQVLASDDPTQTVMATVGDGSSSETHLHQLDIDAAAAIYGAAGTGGVYTVSASGSNAITSWSWDDITQTLTQTAAVLNDTIRGSSVADIITGSSGDDQIFGLAGDDQLNGGQGNDSLYGGTGADTLTGGEGNDSYYVDSASTTIVEQASGGYDAVYATVSFTLPDNVESLSLYGSGLIGRANDQGDSLFGDGTFATTLIGGAGQDYIVGGTGDDRLSGGGGPDTMYGRGGADTFVFTALTDGPIGGTLTTIGDFVSGQDTLDLSGITTGGLSPGQPLSFIGSAEFSNHAGEVRQFSAGGNTVVAGDVDGDGVADFEIQLNGPVSLQSSDFAFSSVPCYCRGTRILTDRGEIAVEDLVVGDRLVTRDPPGRPEAHTLRWIGKRSFEGRFAATNRQVLPVCIHAGALADNVPHRDLWVSPLHALYLEGVLVPAIALVNGISIVQASAVQRVEYFHLEMEHHTVLLAEGAEAESFVDDDSRGMFQNASTFHAMYPDAPTGPARHCAPRVEEGKALEALRAVLAARAGLHAPANIAPGHLVGNLEQADHGRVTGWVRDEGAPDAPVRLHILAGETLLGEVLANRFRGDLLRAGIGDGRHGFDFALPGELSSLVCHTIHVRRAIDGQDIPGAPRVVQPATEHAHLPPANVRRLGPAHRRSVPGGLPI